MSKSFVPELLSPAGNLEKLKVAVNYGANAVYLGGQKFGLRSAADNFTSDELEEGVLFAHTRGARVYVVLNSFLYDKEIVDLPPFLDFLQSINVDAVIVSDLGVLSTVQQHSSLPVHLSTQATCLNSYAAKFWKKMGVKRIIVGRELSIEETGEIKRQTGLEVEMFVHGSLCMAYSGNCVISNYTQGRDSNRGGCAHSCRFEYTLETPDKAKRTGFFMSSKDLRGIRYLPLYQEHHIDSIKVEGRMKSHFYAGTVTKTYAEALSYLKENNCSYPRDLIQQWEEELEKISHRDYTEASLVEKPDSQSVYDERENTLTQQYDVVGVVLEAHEDFILLEVRKAFHYGDQLEIVPFKGRSFMLPAKPLTTVLGEHVERTRPGLLVKLPPCLGVEQWNLVRVKKKS